MYKFICENGHVSRSASREQRNPECATCGEPSRLIEKGQCGCGGEIKQGVGCLAYSSSEEYEHDVAHEGMMRRGGLGFGVGESSDRATMSMHLQGNGFESEEAERVLAPS